MICPNCQEGCVFDSKLNNLIDLFSCPKKCFQIIRDDDNIFHYELEQQIGDERYYLEVYNFGHNSHSVISRITFGEPVLTYPPTPTPRFITTIMKLNYPWIFQSQEELNGIIQRLLNLKAFT
jgi:hypothetical protein